MLFVDHIYLTKSLPINVTVVDSSRLRITGEMVCWEDYRIQCAEFMRGRNAVGDGKHGLIFSIPKKNSISAFSLN